MTLKVKLDNEPVAELSGDLSELLSRTTRGAETAESQESLLQLASSSTPSLPGADAGINQCKIGGAVPVLVTDSQGNGLFKWSPSASDAGPHVLVFKATDTDGFSTEESITLNVKSLPQENRAPNFDWTQGWFGVNPGKQLKIKLYAFDPDGDDVRFFIQKGPEGAEIKDAVFIKKSGKWEATWVYTPERNEAGTTYKVYFTATDDKAGEAKQTTRFTYVHVNEPKLKPRHKETSGKR